MSVLAWILITVGGGLLGAAPVCVILWLRDQRANAHVFGHVFGWPGCCSCGSSICRRYVLPPPAPPPTAVARFRR